MFTVLAWTMLALLVLIATFYVMGLMEVQQNVKMAVIVVLALLFLLIIVSQSGLI